MNILLPPLTLRKHAHAITEIFEVVKFEKIQQKCF